MSLLARPGLATEDTERTEVGENCGPALPL